MKVIKSRLQQKQKVLGTWGTLASSQVVDVISKTGIDFIVFDREHGIVSHETIAQMVPICEKNHVAPIVRVSHLSQDEVQKALDLGAHGLHVPGVVHPEEAEKLVQWAKYPPLGIRGLSPYTAAHGYTTDNLQQKMHKANQNTLLVIHLEGKKALENLSAFLQIPAIDVLFLGLYDLSSSLGLAGQVRHPSVLEVLEKLGEKVQQKGKILGTIASQEEDLPLLQNTAASYITYAADSFVIHQAYLHIVQKYQKVKEVYGTAY